MSQVADIPQRLDANPKLSAPFFTVSMMWGRVIHSVTLY